MHRKANGQADVKAELDAIYTWSNNVRTSKVLKSQIVRGEFHKSVYYAAVECREQPYHAAMRNDGTDGREVYCVVVLIEDATEREFDFMYKDMDEFAGPIEQHCPSNILDLLTETNSEWANDWRSRCRENAEDEVFRAKLSKLPLGSRIELTLDDELQFTFGNPGDTFTLVREQIGRTKLWKLYNSGASVYVQRKWLTRRNTRILPEQRTA